MNNLVSTSQRRVVVVRFWRLLITLKQLHFVLCLFEE